MRVRLDLHYANIGFTRNYNSDRSNPLNIDISKIAISNLDLSPKFEYRLVSLGKLDLFASAGFKFEFALGKYERCYLVNGKLSDQQHVDKSEFTQTQAGAVGGLVFKYNLNEFTAITLSPEYNYFFDKFSSRNDYVMQRTSVNLGVEWRF
jgi:hypothetical protein